ncbi:hypothetical protein HY632_04705 [Candidatus Uhrbacteria bacterium]|nr:hypothetical protein [Candidatus Uhrbacteria bacterium]
MHRSRQSPTHVITETIGWLGAGAVLVAYALVSLGWTTSTSPTFPLLNGFGALGLAAHAVTARDYPIVVLNAIWLLIALIAFLSSS